MQKKLQQKIQQLIQSNFAFDDRVHIPTQLKVENATSYDIYYQDELEDIEVLYVFNHTGWEIPEQFADFIKTDNLDQLAETIYLNHDIGTGFIASHLLEQFATEKNEYKYAVVIFRYSRVIIDSNRLQITEQLVDQPYRGSSPWKKTTGREVISQELVSPFFQRIQELAQLPKLKFVFYPHTMDEYGGGKASGNHEVAASGSRRPPSMIFREYKFTNYPWGDYGEDGKVDFDLVNREQSIAIQRTHGEYLSQIPTLADSEIYTEVDYPYVSPRQLCGLVSRNFAGPQLVLDVRKDLFTHGAAQIAQSVDAISKLFVS